MDVGLEALVLLKELVLTSSLHSEEAVVILQSLANVGNKSEAHKRGFLSAASRALERVPISTAGGLLEQMNQVSHNVLPALV